MTATSPAPTVASPSFGARLGAGLRAAWPLLLVAAVYGAWAITHLYAYGFSNDEGMPLMWARLMRDGYRLYTDIWSDHPPALQWLMVGIFSVWGETSAAVEIGRAILVALSTLGMLAVGGVAWLAADSRWAGLAAVVALALSPLFNWFGRALMPDVPAASLVAVALWVALMARGRRGWAAAAGALYATSLVVKLITLPLAPVVLLGLLWGRPLRREGLRLLIAWALGVLAVAVLALAMVDVPAAYVNIVGTVSGARAGEAWDVWQVVDRWREFALAGHGGMLALALVGAVACLHRRTAAAVSLFAWLALMGLALALHHPLYEHHLSVVLLALAGLAGVGFAQLWRPGVWRVMAGLALALYLAALPTALREGFVPTTDGDAGNWRMVTDLQTLTQPDDWTLSDSTLLAFRAGLRIPPPLIISGKRLESGLLSNATLVQGIAAWRPTSILFVRSGEDTTPFLAWVDHTYRQARRYSASRRIWTPEADGPRLDLAAVPLADGVAFEGYSLAQDGVTPGQPLRLGLFWSSTRPLTATERVGVRLLAGNGQTLAQAESGLPSGAEVNTPFRPGDWAMATHTLPVPADAPPGKADLEISLIDAATGQLVGRPLRLRNVVEIE